MFADTSKQIPSLAIFSESFFKKNSEHYAIVIPNKGLESVHVISFNDQSPLLMKETTIKTQKLCGLFLFMSFYGLKVKEPLQRYSLPFTTKFPEVSSWYSFE